MIYIDTSAMAKLVWQEPETPALVRLVGDGTQNLVSSALLVVETRRAALRRGPENLPRADFVLSPVTKVPITDPIIEHASRLPGDTLRSLDAIHLATALMLRDNIDVFLTYDRRLAEAAEASKIATACPG